LAGSCGAIHGAVTAALTITSKISEPTSAAGLSANRRQAREPVPAGSATS